MALHACVRERERERWQVRLLKLKVLMVIDDKYISRTLYIVSMMTPVDREILLEERKYNTRKKEKTPNSFGKLKLPRKRNETRTSPCV